MEAVSNIKQTGFLLTPPTFILVEHLSPSARSKTLLVVESSDEKRLIHAANNPLAQPIMFAVQHALRQPIALAVSIMTEGVEVPFDAQAGRTTEIIDQRAPFICVPASSNQSCGSSAGSRDRE